MLPELEVKIVDPAPATRAPTGDRGELCCRGYNVMKGYYNNPEATPRGHRRRTAGCTPATKPAIDPDGYLRITGRIKDMIIRGGENISPKEIEDCLREHPAVADAYVYGVPDDFFGEGGRRGRPAVGRTCSQTTPRPSADADRLVRERLARFKVPRYRPVRHGLSDDGVRKGAEVQAEGSTRS